MNGLLSMVCGNRYQGKGCVPLGRDVVLVLLFQEGLLVDEVHPVVLVPEGALAVGHQLDPVRLDVLLHVVPLDESPTKRTG